MFLKKKINKNKDGSERVYLQLVESRRIKGKASPNPFVLMNLGRLDTGEALNNLENQIQALIKESQTFKILDIQKHLKGESSKEYGPYLVFQKIWKELELNKILSPLNKNKEGIDYTDVLFNMVLNRLSEPCSKRKLNLWQEKIYGINNYELHSYYRCMDYYEEQKQNIENILFKSMQEKSKAVDIALFDTTTIVYYGEGDKEETLLANGFSKAKRGDLKQVVIGVIMSGDGIPIGYEVFSGNTNDVTCFKNIIDKISEKFKVREVILVGDRGMISEKNINHLTEKGYSYVLGYRMRTISKKDRQKIFSKLDLKIINKKSLQYKEIKYNGLRLVFCYNPERAKLDALKREEIVNRLREKIKSGSIKSVITNKDYKKYLKVTHQKAILDEEKIKQDELYDGVYVLTTNTKLSCTEIIDTYKGLWQVEMAFKNLKSEIEMGPLYHWKDRRIRAHIFICFLSLILRNYLYQKLKVFDKELSYSDALEHVKDLHAMIINIDNQPVTLRTELKTYAINVFKAIKLKIPDRILASSFNKKLFL